MSGDRVLGSYLVRVSVRDGRRDIALHDVARGRNRRFATFAELAAFLERDAEPADPPRDPRRTNA